jgi:Raf kinase inhibitor-like YbhB/YbcL family protein
MTKLNISFLMIVLIGSLLLNGCQLSTQQNSRQNTPPNSTPNYPSNQNISMQLSTPSFANNSSVPVKFTCQGQNINPELQISGVPSDAKSLALILDDPDAPNGDFVHWVVWNIPANTKSIPENASAKFAVQGSNGASKQQYMGPCPPTGIHRYFFRLYALASLLEIPTTSIKADLLKAMEGKILDETQLMGTYRKS